MFIPFMVSWDLVAITVSRLLALREEGEIAIKKEEEEASPLS